MTEPDEETYTLRELLAVAEVECEMSVALLADEIYINAVCAWLEQPEIRKVIYTGSTQMGPMLHNMVNALVEEARK